MLSRRAFLQLTALAAPSLTLAPHLLPFSPTALPFALFFDVAALPTLRAHFANHPLFATLRDELRNFDRAAERRFFTSEIDYTNKWQHVQRTSETAYTMAFYALMKEDDDAAALAQQALRTLMRFPKWDYFLEAGTDVIGLQRAPDATRAVALGTDWLGDYIERAERAEWLRTMAERGCEPCFRSIYGMRYKDRVAGWSVDTSSAYFKEQPGELDLSNWPTILDATNLKAVPASALAIGALAYKQQFGASDDTARWLEQAIYSLRSFQNIFAPDGSYPEGVGYANYTALHMAQALHALWRHEQVDLYDAINWPGYVEFLQETTMPTDDHPASVVNFGDSWGGNPSAAPFWIAGRSHDARAQWFGEEMSGHHNLWSVIWYAERPTQAPPARPHHWKNDLGWLTARTGYAADDLVVAFRSGGQANHEHADRNSLIIKCFGERLVDDPGHAPYGHADPAWMLRTTAGHSALLIDGKGHQYHDGSEGTNASQAVAHLIRSGERDGYSFWSSDATPAYQLVLPDVTSVTRSVVVLYDLPAVLVIDKVLKATTPSILETRFFVKNDDGHGGLEAQDDHFLIVRPLAKLRGAAHAPAGVAVQAQTLPIPEETALQHPFAAATTQEAQMDPLLMTVLLPAPADGTLRTARFSPAPDGTYTIELRHDDRTVHCHVFDTGALPEFDVEV